MGLWDILLLSTENYEEDVFILLLWLLGDIRFSFILLKAVDENLFVILFLFEKVVVVRPVIIPGVLVLFESKLFYFCDYSLFNLFILDSFSILFGLCSAYATAKNGSNLSPQWCDLLDSYWCVLATVYFFTLGLLGIGWLIDLFLMPSLDRQADIRFRPGRVDYNIAWGLLTFLGFFGVHRMYMGKWLTGILYLCTGGLFLLGYLYDYWTLNDQITVANGR